MVNEPLINILIRVSRIGDIAERCFNSVIEQTYSNYKTILYPDNSQVIIWLSSLLPEFEDSKLCMYRREDHMLHIPYHYNLFCNTLKHNVQDGWFFFLDDDDKLVSKTALENIAEHLTDPDQPVICQMLRNGNPKPSKMYMDMRSITRGRIGMPCIVLHSKHKDIAEFQATEDADYRFIKSVSEKLKCKFVQQVLVDAGSRNHGAAII